MISRQRRRARDVLASIAATAFITTASAQTPPPAAPAPKAGADAPTKEAAREQTAMKIAGLVAFVANSCPKLKPDYARFKEVIHALGVDERQLDKQDMRSKYLSYTAAYQQDTKASCEKAVTQFGPDGTTVPKLFAVQ